MDTVNVIFIGKRLLNNNKSGHAFITTKKLSELMEQRGEFDERYPSEFLSKIDRNASYFTVKSNGPGSVGAIYVAPGEINEEGRVTKIVIGKIAYNSRLPDEYAEFVLAWQMMNDEVEQQKRIASAEKRAINDRELDAAITVIKNRYKRIPPSYRRGFSMWLEDKIKER